MSMIVPSNYDLNTALQVLIVKYVRGGANTPLVDNTVKAKLARENFQHGYREGMAESIAEILTVERIKKFPLFTHHEKVNAWDVKKVVDPHPQVIFGQVPEDGVVEDLSKDMCDLLDGKDGQIAEMHESERRKRVLDGRIKPTEDDREWLLQMLAEKKQTLDYLAQLIDPAEEKTP